MYTSQDNRDARRFAWLWIVVAFFLVAGVLGIRALYVVPNAAVGVVEKTLDPNNIITKYEWFFNTAGAINARAAQVRVHKELVAAETNPAEKNRLRIELVGQQQSCRELVQGYNMNAAKANVSIFKTDATPVSFSPSICE